MLAPNTLFQNRYLIISQINKGNMGAVYLARDTRLDNDVALKETFFTASEADAREQFHREARLLSRLRHPSLPRVIDHFIEGNGQYLVMDYITGKDLEELLRANKGPFPVERALDWACQLLDVLVYLHSQDEPVIHRDIKPANMKLTPQGRIILLDFGLAKGSSASLQLSFRAATPAYAPLEQMTLQGTDARSDLYSFAVTLYHLMTGELPPLALQRKDAVWKGSPDPLIRADHINPHIPVKVADALTRAMSLQSDDRPQTASEMRESLKPEVVKPPDPPPPPMPDPAPPIPKRAARNLWVTVGGIVSIAIAIAAIAIAVAWALSSKETGIIPSTAQQGEVPVTPPSESSKFVEDLGLQMVEIKGGAFLMGSPDSEANRDSDEGPQHQVTVSSFYMGKYEVKQSEWRAVATKLPKVKIDLNADPSNFKGDDLPVEQVSWEEAVEFCDRLSKATGKKYRLPTEAEWEYACRAGTTGPYAGNLDSMAWYFNNSGSKTHTVGTKQPNEFGLYDMHGNVWEWCGDWYSEDYYKQRASADPTGPGAGSDRVIRGGSWYLYAQYCRSAIRLRYTPTLRFYNLGFRLVRTYN